MEYNYDKSTKMDRRVKFSIYILAFALLAMMFCNIEVNIKLEDLQYDVDILREEHTALQEKYSVLQDDYDTLLAERETLQEEKNKLVIDNMALQTQLEEKPRKDILELAGEIYRVDPKLLEAIERLESGHYTSSLYTANNNTWGAFNGKEYKSFSSHEQSTVELARTLRNHYINQGLDTIEEIGAKYCPADPLWSIKVRSIYNNIT